MIAFRFEDIPGQRRRPLWWAALLLLSAGIVLFIWQHQLSQQRQQLSRAKMTFAAELRQARMCWLVRGFDAQRYAMECDHAEQLRFSEAGWPIGGYQAGAGDAAADSPCQQIWKKLMGSGVGGAERADGQNGIDLQGVASEATVASQCRYFLHDNPRLSFRYDMRTGEVE